MVAKMGNISQKNPRDVEDSVFLKARDSSIQDTQDFQSFNRKGWRNEGGRMFPFRAQLTILRA